jgi:uncharacterized repeat protein (TIGR03803 family)
LVLAARLAGAQVTFDVLAPLPGGGASGPSALVQGADGNLYGTTNAGGVANRGTVYRMTPSGAVTVLHHFAGGTADGANPQASLIQWTDRNFYGTTDTGGVANLGTVFRMTAAGDVTVLHAFAGGAGDGAHPQAALIAADDGNFYGTTAGGGAVDAGTIFRITPGGDVTILHRFTHTFGDRSVDGAIPVAPLLQANDGNFYGTTSRGGRHESGTVFRMTPGGVLTVVYEFQFDFLTFNEPATPLASLIQASDGHLYGTYSVGGPRSGGVFRLTLGGVFTRLHQFQGADGFNPAAPLLQAADGNFYGTASSTIFQTAAGGTFEIVRTFSSSEGSSSTGLLQAADARFYGTTKAGIVFRFSVTPQVPVITLQPVSQTVKAGRQVMFTARATGLPASTYQWQVSTDAGVSWTNLADDGRSSGSATPTLAVAVTNRGPDGYRFRVLASNDAGSTASTAAMLTVQSSYINDLDADGKADLMVFRPSGGNWYIRQSTGGPTPDRLIHWGRSGDVPVPGDYDGDGKLDLAVWRLQQRVPPEAILGHWEILTSSSNYTGSSTSQVYIDAPPGTLPVPGDYDGDGKTDIAQFNPRLGLWSVVPSSRFTSGDPSTLESVTFALGLGRDIPVPADYDGDGKTDVAVFRPSTGTWIARQSGSGSTTSLILQWGLSGDVPVPGDYDGDGQADLAVYRPAFGLWYVLRSTTGYATFTTTQWGLSGDVPVPADYDADGKIDLAVYRPSNGTWYIRYSTTGYASSASFPWGENGDVPIPNAAIANGFATAGTRPTISPLASLFRSGDLLHSGRAQLDVFRPSTGRWFAESVFVVAGLTYAGGFFVTEPLGSPADLPVAGDYDGDGTTDRAVYTPSTGVWTIQPSTQASTVTVTYQWGLSGDTPVPGDYDGDGRIDIGVYRPDNGVWYLRKSGTNPLGFVAIPWGIPGDVPVPGDYDGDGVTDLAVFRPSNGVWYVLKSSTGYTDSAIYQWGLSGDITVPGDYDGDGKSDVAVYRPSNGVWYIRKSSSSFSAAAAYAVGASGDIPVPSDYDGDGKTDVVVWRPSTGVWFARWSSTDFTATAAIGWGEIGDVPVQERR